MTRFRLGSVSSSRRLPQRASPHFVAFLTLATCAWRAPAAAQSIAELQVTPETMTLGVGKRQTIFAAAYDRQGNLISSAKFIFWSSDTLIARVAADGTVLGVSPGLAKVEARLKGRRASLAVLITGSERGGDSGSGAAPPGSVLTLDPSSLVLLPGERVLITPQAMKEGGAPGDLGRVVWKSLKPEVATVDSNGVVAALIAGKSIIQATTSSGLMATAPVEVAAADVVLSQPRLVLAPQDAETLRVLVPSQGNRVVRGAVRWRSADSAVVTVDSMGMVRARGPGQTDVVAAGFGQERRVQVLVHPMPEAIVVSPRQTAGATQIPLQASRRFTAVAEAADSTPIPQARIVWEVGDTGVIARDSAKGTITAKRPGTSTLTARLRGFEPVVWTIQVVPGVLGLDQSRVGLAPGDRDTLAAALIDDQGKAVGPAGSLEWTSEKPAVATVSASGEVTGVSAGHTIVTAATPWGGRVSADVFVVADLLVASNRSGNYGIYQVRSSDPSTFLPLLTDSGANVQAALSADRTRIAFSSNRGGGYDLWVMDADGRNLRRLTTDPGDEGEPAWTPDGTRIVYTHTAVQRNLLPQLAIIHADGSDNRPLTSGPGGNRLADVSPDGSTIAFVSTRDGGSRIFAMALDGTGQRRITKGSDRESQPRFLPVGELIFTVERGGGSRLQRLAAGAAQSATVLETQQPIVALDVSRDGTRIAYSAGKLAEAGKGKSQLVLMVQSLAPGSAAAPVPLRPGEQILSVSF